MKRPVDFARLKRRPASKDRLFVSEAVERLIERVSPGIGDPTLRRMFTQCLPNTFDTTTHYREVNGKPETFITTGDIPAMWLRDSTNQVWPYLRLAGQDEAVRKLFAGLVRSHAHMVLTDPYANAFVSRLHTFPHKTWWKRGRAWKKTVWERKYELDSLASFLRLSAGYFDKTGDITPFDAMWTRAIASALKVFEREQETLDKDALKTAYRFFGPDGKPHPAVRIAGYEYPGKKCGLVRTGFRPSDDETVFPYLIPANAMAVVALRDTARILERLMQPTLANTARRLADEIDEGIRAYGVVEHPKFGKIFAYEVDGFGSCCLMDDPNVPSLLSLPYLGYCRTDDPIYQATRRFILSNANPFYAKGRVAAGLTSPHAGTFNQSWPMATAMQAMTSTDDEEIRSCLDTLAKTHAGTYFMHESVNVDNPRLYTRAWFSWANSLFGELILDMAQRKPHILSA